MEDAFGMNEEMKAPTPAAGEAVAWLIMHKVTGNKELKFTPLPDLPFNRERFEWRPLYAAPHPPEQCANIAHKSEQPPATGGDAVARALRGLYGAVNARSVRGRDHVPSMRDEQKAMLEALKVLRSLRDETA